jgi:hypothetical protein
MENNIYLRRYTSLSAAIRLLLTRRLTLLSPDTWEDQVDRKCIEKYRRKKRLKSALCLCFTEADETYHHWKVFAPGSDGVCIVFEKKVLISAIPSEIIHRKVKYYSNKSLEFNAVTTTIDDLPFIKRSQFEPESEFRMLWTSSRNSVSCHDIEFPSESLERIILNPWMPKPLVEAVSVNLQAMFKSDGYLGVQQSKIIDISKHSPWSNLLTSK